MALNYCASKTGLQWLQLKWFTLSSLTIATEFQLTPNQSGHHLGNVQTMQSCSNIKVFIYCDLDINVILNVSV